jgi:hypothetical protein
MVGDTRLAHIRYARIGYKYGAVEEIIAGRGFGLSALQPENVTNVIFKNERKRCNTPVMGVYQSHWSQSEDFTGVLGALANTSQRIFERTYGKQDQFSPFLIGILYDSQTNTPEEITAALPKSCTKRFVVYPLNKRPNFGEKRHLVIDDDARSRIIGNSLTARCRDYLVDFAKLLETAGKLYGLTLPEVIMLDMAGPNSEVVAKCMEGDETIEQKTDLFHMFLLMSGARPEIIPPLS